MSLGLGGSGQHIAPAGAPGVPGAPFPVGGVTPLGGGLSNDPVLAPVPVGEIRTGCDDTQNICHHITTPHGRFIYTFNPHECAAKVIAMCACAYV